LSLGSTTSRTLIDLIAIRRQRELRAAQELAARRLHAAQREQQLQRDSAALQHSRDQHLNLTQRLYEEAQTGARNAAQLCADLACLQTSADVVAQRRGAADAARHALQAAVAEMDASRHLYRQACAACERVNQLHCRARKAALVRRGMLEELAEEALREAGNARANRI
jgi:hypothetical protein